MSNAEGTDISASLARKINRKYFDFSTSDLEYEIKSGEVNDFKIELDPPGPR